MRTSGMENLRFSIETKKFLEKNLARIRDLSRCAAA